MKKQYIPPTSISYFIEADDSLCFATSENFKGNGEHKGWDNPHNPHYKNTEEPPYRTSIWND